MSRLKYANWNAKFRAEQGSSRQPFMITEEISIDKRTVEGIKGGIFSPELGSPIDTDKDIREFSCVCGEKHGRWNEGDFCELCNSPVEMTIGADIDRFGWFDIAPYFVINPAMYEMINKVVGAKNLNKILDYQVSLDIEGHASVVQVDPKNPYANIGLIDFRHQFNNIINHYGASRGKNAEAALLLSNKASVFSDKIPVMSGFLRPSFTTAERRMFTFDGINKIYSSIVTNAKLLKNSMSGRTRTVALPYLFQIQKSLQDLYATIIRTKLSGKTRRIRAGILGSRLDFSSRMVIVSMVGKYASMDSVEMSYKGFLELYKLEIINCMMRGYGDPTFANKTIFECLIYLTKAEYSEEIDEPIYSIIQQLIEWRKAEGGLRVLINRNPTLDMGSIQCMKIVHVTKDATDKTLGIPLTSLKAMNADFDGDVLNIFCLKERCVIEAFDKGFNPRFMTLDRTGDRYFNNDVALIKDQMTNLASFASVSRNTTD